MAALIGAANAQEIVFTSGGTEANHLAIPAPLTRLRATGRGEHIVTTAIEHPAVLADLSRGSPPRVPRHPRPASERRRAALEPADIDAPSRRSTVLVSVMHANNEIGTLQPLADIADARPRARHPAAHRRRAAVGQASAWTSTTSASIC